MKHDVFISYSRKDIKIAEGLCEVLRQNGVDYWIDDNNIHGSANFLAEITKNLKQCKAVIFVASANSAASEWTQKELLFAIKHSKDIIPYKIGEFSFDDNDELDFVFSNVQWVDSVDKVIVALREKGFVGIKPVPQPPVPEPPVPPTPKPRLPWWVWALIAALAVAVGVGLLGGDRGKGGDLDAQQHQADSFAQVVEAERHRSDSLALVAQRLEKEKSDRAEQERNAKEKAEKETTSKVETVKQCNTRKEISINTYYQWTRMVSPSTLYRAYQSYSNCHQDDNAKSIMNFSFSGYDEFTFYIRSDGEPFQDYVMVGINEEPTAASNYANTKGLASSGTEMYDYTPVRLSNLDKMEEYTIYVVYRKDLSVSVGADRGYVLIPYVTD